MTPALGGNEKGAAMHEFRWVRGHVEVFSHGLFQFSADSMEEAVRELSIISEEGGTKQCKPIPETAEPE